MSAPQSWHEANDAYLSASVAALRARLERFAAQAAGGSDDQSEVQRHGESAQPGPKAPAPPAQARPSPTDATDAVVPVQPQDIPAALLPAQPAAQPLTLVGRLFRSRAARAAAVARQGAPAQDGAKDGAGDQAAHAPAPTVAVPKALAADDGGDRPAALGPSDAAPASPEPPPRMELPPLPPPPQSGHTPALVLLAERFGMSSFERDTLLLCAAIELDTRVAALCARAQGAACGPASASYPSFALAMALFDHPQWDVLSPERPLRYWRLVEIGQQGAQALVASPLRIDERILNCLKGLSYLDDRLVLFATPAATGTGATGGALPPSQSRVVDEITARVGAAQGVWSLPLFQLTGSDGASKLAVAGKAAQRLGLNLYRVVAEQLPAQAGDQDLLLRLWQRECCLQPLALYIDASQVDRGSNPQAAALQRWFGRGVGVAFLDSREAWPDPGCASVGFEVAKPTREEQRAAWLAALGEDQAALAARLAGQFSFSAPTIWQLVANVAARSGARAGDEAPAAGEPGAGGAQLWQECLRQSRPALHQLAQPVQARAAWDDLKLPAPEKRLLRQIADQVAGRMTVYDDWGFRGRASGGLGISVLFAGESGTGKTMAAEVIAQELGLLLYRIDLSAVVSKYIGETEKNLRKLFDAAEDGGAILFFDEADALFGKRSEVKDSHDRYANIEINYLLQRMEAYGGLAILATNMKSALDGAFLRRLRFVVNFPFPAVAERMAIWQHAFPAETPLGELDFERLARLNITGGNISNIALNAAFLAAQAGKDGRVTMPLLLEAARNEFRKMERPINEADFRWLEAAGSKA